MFDSRPQFQRKRRRAGHHRTVRNLETALISVGAGFAGNHDYLVAGALVFAGIVMGSVLDTQERGD